MKTTAHSLGRTFPYLLAALLSFGCGANEESDGEVTDETPTAGMSVDESETDMPDSAGEVERNTAAGASSSRGGQAVNDDGCVDDESCAENEYCAAGVDGAPRACTEGCRIGGDGCGEQEECSADNVCVLRRCQVDAECADDSYCYDGKCTEGCRLNDDACPEVDGVPQACEPSTRMCTAKVQCCPNGAACRDTLPSECTDQSCESDDECSGAQTCGASGVCVEPSPCSADVDCLNDRICEGETCVEPCREDAACSGAQICDDGRCVDRPECQADDDCPSGNRCIEGQCSLRCDADTPCAAGFECSERGICLREVECTTDDECDVGLCQGGQCIVECDGETPCPAGQGCSLQNTCEPICVPENCQSGECASNLECAPPCQANAECRGAQICEATSGQCVDPCIPGDCGGGTMCDVDSGRCVRPAACANDPESCPEGMECGENNLCVVAPECRMDMQCAQAGGVCENNECVPGCTSVDGGRPCGDGRICDPSTLRCVDPGCGGGVGCPETFVCGENNVCVSACRISEDCPGNRQCNADSGLCPELSQNCRAMLDCDGDRICDCAARGDCGPGGGRCVAPCRDDDSCTAADPLAVCSDFTGLCERDPDACIGPSEDALCGNGRICGENQRCTAGCRDDGDCFGGLVCLQNQCAAEPQCRVTADCNPGLRCENFTCVDTCFEPGDCDDWPGYVCNQIQVCEPDLNCAFDDDCSHLNDNICIDNICTPKCTEPANCPGAQVCEFASGRCIDGCEQTGCPNGQICNVMNHECEEAGPECLGDNDGNCAANEICEQGACVDGCRLDAQCLQNGEICENNACVAGCTGPLGVRPCADPLICDVIAHRCVDAACAQNGQCPETFVCSSDNQCIRACTDNADCPGNRDCVAGLCPEKTNGCLVADDCDADRICDCVGTDLGCFGQGGQCIDACGPDRPCARGVCDPDGSGFCVSAAAGCGDDSACIEGEICTAGACVADCETAGCPGTRECDVVTGRCPEPATCFSDFDCDASTRCNVASGDCVAACNGAQACENGLFCDDDLLICRGCENVSDCPNDFWSCDQNTGACTPPLSCVFDEDCPATEVCDIVTGDCVAGCVIDDECPGQQVCGPTSVCEENDNGCQNELDCLRDRVCAQGVCAERCVGDASCPGVQTCNHGSGQCQEANGGACVGAEDCLGARVCLGGQCRNRECLTNADCAGACVDFVCIDAPPAECVIDTDCGQGQTCTALGACVRTAAGCTEDVQCPDATPYCRGGACVVCSIDDECGTAYVCINERCVYEPPANCIVDTDCSASQRCVQDDEGAFVCSPGVCPGNPMNGEQLVARTYTGLVLCDGAENRYTYDVPAGEGVRVEVRHAPNQGDLSLELLDGETSIGRTDGIYGVEALAILPSADARTLTIVVNGRAGAPTSYDLTIQVLDPTDCGPDGYEGVLGNDTQPNATTVDRGEHRLNLCVGDADWLQLDAVAGSELTVTVDGLAADIQATMVPAAGQTQQNGAQTTFTTQVNADGPYYVHIVNDGNVVEGVNVSVNATASENGAATACANAAEFGNEISVEGVRRNTVQRTAALTPRMFVQRFNNLGCAEDGVGQTQEHVFHLRLAEDAELTIEVEGIFYGAVEVQPVCNSPNANNVCTRVGPGEDNQINRAAVLAGDYFVIVHSLPRQNPTIKVTYAYVP